MHQLFRRSFVGLLTSVAHASNGRSPSQQVSFLIGFSFFCLTSNHRVMPRRNVYVFDLDDCIAPTTRIIQNCIIDGYNFYHLIRPIPGLRDLIHSLNGLICLFTNSTTYHCLTILHAMRLMDLFDVIVDRTVTGGILKPNIAAYQIFCAQARIRKSDNVIFFDDRLENLCAARYFKWNCYWITPASSALRHRIQSSFYDHRFTSLLAALHHEIYG